jgi:hypothetical protein
LQAYDRELLRRIVERVTVHTNELEIIFRGNASGIFFVAHTQPLLTTRFLEILNLMRQPAALLEPRMALRVWSGNRRCARDPLTTRHPALYQLPEKVTLGDSQSIRDLIQHGERREIRHVDCDWASG